VAGAVLQQPLRAQDTVRVRRDTIRVPIPPRADSLLRRDSLARRDSAPVARRDSIKAPLAHSEMPAVLGVGRRLQWDRAELFATGALTVQDLLERIAGVTTLRAGWLAAPAVAAYLGDPRRVRVFYDGVERDELDPRAGGVSDLSQINLWSLEDAAVEEGAGEVRVYLRSWRVSNTSASTRTDIGTGDQQTNLYRGFFGRRYDNGQALQFAAQQFGTTPPNRFGSSSDQLGLLARVGWATRSWSVDASANRASRHRGVIIPDLAGDSIPGVESSRYDAYVRVGYADPDTSPVWAQLLAAASKYDYTGIRTKRAVSSSTDTTTVSLDTSAFRAQYVLSAGTSVLGARLSATERLRVGARHWSTPSLRGSYLAGPLAVSAFLDSKGPGALAHSDVVAQLAPTSFINLLAAAGRTTDSRVEDSTWTTTYVRGEAGLRLFQIWLIGGLVRRDSARLGPPRIFDTTLVTRADGPATGVTAAIRGSIWGPVGANLSVNEWTDSPRYYRARYQTRSELFVATNLLRRIPSGNFGLRASVTHEYRSDVSFPTGPSDMTTVPGYRTISTLLELRVVGAIVSWQFRNFLGERYTQVLGFAAPRQTNFYGVRWEFWN